MSERTVVHLLRHGEVNNPDHVLYGRLPGFHLSDAGQAMAKRAAVAVAERDIVAVISSPLERAIETATPVAEQFDLDIAIDDRLIEATNVFEGLTFGVGDGSLRRPAHWRYLTNPFRPSWGEPYRELAARMLAAVASARDACPRSRSDLRQPPAADLDSAPRGGGSASVARPAPPAVRAWQPDELHFRWRHDHQR